MAKDTITLTSKSLSSHLLSASMTMTIMIPQGRERISDQFLEFILKAMTFQIRETMGKGIRDGGKMMMEQR